MEVDQAVREIERNLRKAGIAKRAEFAQGYTPSSEEIYGVPVPVMRPIAKGVTKVFRDAGGEAVLRLANALIDTRVHECRVVAYEVVAGHPAAFARLDAERLEELGRGLDNWATVDTFARGLTGPAWRRGQITDARIARWARDVDRWWRRTAVVSTVALNEKRHVPDGDPERTLAVCEMVLADKDEMVIKALSWALRALSERDRAAVASFLDRNEGRVPALVRREVRQKLDTGRKTPRRAPAT